jgi:hypothetical protein
MSNLNATSLIIVSAVSTVDDLLTVFGKCFGLEGLESVLDGLGLDIDGLELDLDGLELNFGELVLHPGLVMFLCLFILAVL